MHNLQDSYDNECGVYRVVLTRQRRAGIFLDSGNCFAVAHSHHRRGNCFRYEHEACAIGGLELNLVMEVVEYAGRAIIHARALTYAIEPITKAGEITS